MYDTAATILHGAKTDTDVKVPNAKLSLNWTAPYKVLAVGPCTPADTPDGSPLGAELVYLDLPSDMPGADARRRVSVQRCKPCANPHDHDNIPKYLPTGLTQYVLKNFSKTNPHDHDNIPKYLPTGLTQYVLKNFSKKCSPHHVTQDGVSSPLQRLEVEKVIGHQSVHDRGGAITVMYEITGRVFLDRPGSGKWTSSFFATRYCATGRALRIRTAQPTACTAGCGLVLHIGNFFGETVSDSWLPVTAAFLAQNGRAATAPRCFPTEPAFGTRATTVCGGVGRSEDQREHDYGWGIFGALFGRHGADQASFSYSGALHDFDRSGTRFFVSTSTLS